MAWIIGILTFFLVFNAVLLSLLVLAQKPKKDTGGGLAFGGAATDALFGAGSGDLFTKMTKYATAAFFILTLTLSILNAQQTKRRGGDPRQRVSASERQADLPPAPVPAAAKPSTTSTSAPLVTSSSTGSPGALLSMTNLLLKPTNGPASANPTSPPPVNTPKAEDEKK